MNRMILALGALLSVGLLGAEASADMMCGGPRRPPDPPPRSSSTPPTQPVGAAGVDRESRAASRQAVAPVQLGMMVAMGLLGGGAAAASRRTRAKNKEA